MAKPPTKKQSTGKPGPSTRAKAPVKSGRPAGLFTWVAVGLVAVVIAVLVLVKVIGGDGSSATGKFEPTSAALAAKVLNIPASTFDTVGVTSPAINVSYPTATTNQSVLKWADTSGVKRPTVFYFGSEYCPYCAAQRWALIIALSRFGTFANLGNTASAHNDAFPDTPTFTFLKSTYTSQYINFKAVEQFSNVLNSAGTNWVELEKPTATQIALVQKYDSPNFIPGLPASSSGSIPFVTFANQYLMAGASFSPSTLAGLTRDQIASVLKDPTNRLTQGIVASANYMTARICAITANKPVNVCSSSAVAAAKAKIGR